MTDADILNCLMFCEHKDCETCHRDGGENCEKQLIKDARTVIKMQIDTMRSLQEEVVRLQGENKRLQDIGSSKLSEEDVVNAVNNIVDACLFYADFDSEAGEFERMIDMMLDFTKMLTNRYAVTIFHDRKAPEIVKC